MLGNTTALTMSRHSKTLESWQQPHLYLPFSETNRQHRNTYTDYRDDDEV